MVVPWFCIQGGLGNQLFQWFFAHAVVQDESFKVHLNFEPFDRSGQLHYELLRLEKRCIHCMNKEGFVNPRMRKSKIFGIQRKLIKNRFAAFVLDGLGFVKEDVGSAKFAVLNFKNFADGRFFSGYFQDKQVLQGASSAIDAELIPIIRDLSLAVLERLNVSSRDYSVVHVRKTPFDNKNRSSLGNLSKDYYLAWERIHKTGKLFLLCKDEIEVQFLCDVFPRAIIMSSNEIGAWEALALMSEAEYLLSANSTLSWWGAYLCHRNGGHSYLPSSWSCWEQVDTEKLNFEGTINWPSKWDWSNYVDWSLVSVEAL